MKYLRLFIAALSAGVLLTTLATSYAPAAAAQEKQQTNSTTDGSKTSTTTTGFPTGATCKKSGTYRAENKYLEVILVLEEGEIFPPFVDGEKTNWFALTPVTKSTFEAVKSTTPN